MSFCNKCGGATDEDWKTFCTDCFKEVISETVRPGESKHYALVFERNWKPPEPSGTSEDFAREHLNEALRLAREESERQAGREYTA